MKLENKEVDILFFCAFRYALGRMSYIVSDVAELIELHWTKLPEKTQTLIVKELGKAIREHENNSKEDYLGKFGRLGMEQDYRVWKRLFEKVK